MFFIYKINKKNQKRINQGVDYVPYDSIYLISTDKNQIRKSVLPFFFFKKDYTSFLFFYKIQNTTNPFDFKNKITEFLLKKKGIAFVIPNKNYQKLIKVILAKKIPFIYPNDSIINFCLKSEFYLSKEIYKCWRLMLYLRYINSV